MTKIYVLLFLAITFSQVLAFNPPHYCQRDPRWGRERLGAGPDTIHSGGCLMTSVASMLAGCGVKVNGQLPNPSTMNAWLKAHNGYVGDNFKWASIGPLGFRFQGHVKAKADITRALSHGKYVILCVNHGHHYVLAKGIAANGYSVMDPAMGGKSVYGFGEVVNAAIYQH